MSLTWGTPRQVVDDYVLVRGDLTEEYAREQLADWIERYATRVANQALADAGQGWLHNCKEGERWAPGLRCGVCGKGFGDGD